LLERTKGGKESIMKNESIQELVDKRMGYKYLRLDNTSPYQNYNYVLRKKKVFPKASLNTNKDDCCGEGWNLATMQWILKNADLFNCKIVEFSIPSNAEIVVPYNTDGKFRTDLICYERQYMPVDLFPSLKNLKIRLKNYKPINPIVAAKMPPVRKLTTILTKVGAQVGAQVGDQVWAQVGAQVRAQVGAQVGIITYYAIKLFLNLEYDHPAFDLIRLGVVVLNVMGKYKAFGKNGKFLGEISKL